MFQLAAGLEPKKLEEGTLFNSGKQDVDGNDIEYRLEKEVIVDHALVESLKTLYLDLEIREQKAGETKPTNLAKGTYMTPVANSFDGQGEGFQPPFNSWKTLGAINSKMPKEGSETEKVQHPHPMLGLLLASDVFLAKRGEAGNYH